MSAPSNPLFPEISPGNKTNMKTLIRAANGGVLHLVSCYDTHTGKFVDAVCAVSYRGSESEPGSEALIYPFALMDKEVPLYERLVPCSDEVGLHEAMAEYQRKHEGGKPT